MGWIHEACSLFLLQNLCFHLAHGLGVGSRLVKKSGCRRGSGRSAGTRGMPEGPSKAAGLRRLLGVLEDEPFQETLKRHSSRRQPRWSSGGRHLLESFASSSRKRLSRKSELASARAEPSACSSRRACCRLFSRATTASAAWRVRSHELG